MCIVAFDTIGLLFPKLPTPTKVRNARARKRLRDIFSQVITKRSDAQVQSSPFFLILEPCTLAHLELQDSPDYLGMLWKEEGNNHGMDTFATHILGILFAAHTNTAGTTAWTLAQFASNKALGYLPKPVLRL